MLFAVTMLLSDTGICLPTCMFCRSDNKVTEAMVDATAYVIDAKGDKVTVIHPNLFVSDVSDMFVTPSC